jgi:hypothetical protein
MVWFGFGFFFYDMVTWYGITRYLYDGIVMQFTSPIGNCQSIRYFIFYNIETATVATPLTNEPLCL